MKIIHSERINRAVKKSLKGYIAINTRTFKPHKRSHVVIMPPLSNEEFPFLYIRLHDLIGCCVIYKNKDTTSELVYIHDAASLGYSSHQSFIDSNRLSKDEFILDISGLDIPDSYDVLDKSGQLSVPYVNIEEIVHRLETLSLEDKKRYISIALFSILYKEELFIRNLRYNHNYTTIQRIVSNINKIIEIVEEHNIIINMEDILKWVMDGIHYLGFRKYTAFEIAKINGAHAADVSCWTYAPTNFNLRTYICLGLNKERTHVTIDNVNIYSCKEYYNVYSYKEYYNDPYIPYILHFIYRDILGIENYTL